jgi:hypothetical protein
MEHTGLYSNFIFCLIFQEPISETIWVKNLQKIFMFYYFVFPFAYNYLYIIFKLIILFVCLNRLFISLVAMDPSCKTYVKNDLISLHYVTFIELLAICPTETPSFDSDQFTDNSINEVIEEKTNDPFLLLEEHFFTAFLVYKKLMNYNLKIYRMKFSTLYGTKVIHIATSHGLSTSYIYSYICI